MLEGNKIHHCNNFRTSDSARGSLGGINIKVNHCGIMDCHYMILHSLDFVEREIEKIKIFK